MSSITLWQRLEPRARDIDMAESLAARASDPLWYLTRQWQVGEFRGEDGGSAVAADLRGVASRISRLRRGPDGPAVAYDPVVPLEAQVESMPYRADAPTVRDAAEAGFMWLRMLRDAELDIHAPKYLGHAPLAAEDAVADGGEPASRAYRGVLGGRVPDGISLLAEFDAALRPPGGGSGDLPALPDVGGDRNEVGELARRFLAWADKFVLEPDLPSAWRPSKFEYQFAVAAASDRGEIVLEADEYPGGHLDWYSFRLGGRGLETTGEAGSTETVERTVTPAAVEIPGGPASRFWTFEDGVVDFGRLGAGPEDLARLLHAEFGLLFGDDWLLVPLDLAVGTVFRTDRLEVHDTFGTKTAVGAATESDDPTSRWGFFHLSDQPGATTPPRRPAPLFLVAPALASSLAGPPVEEVLILRDEMANLVWGVERRIESSRGRGLDRAEMYQRGRQAAAGQPAQASVPEAEVRYRMLGRVPDYWIPFMPVRSDASNRAITLQRGSVRDPKTGEPLRPLGRLLVPQEPLFVDEEEATRAGVRLTRAAQYARSSDGGIHLWMGHRKRTGRGEGSSGVAFDRIDPVDDSH